MSNIELLIATLLLAFNMFYGVQMKRTYPHLVTEGIQEPIVRITAYFIMYLAAQISPIAGLMGTIALVLIQLDYINLMTKVL